MNRTCLNCCYLSEPDDPHKWHVCEWAAELPACIDRVSTMIINIEAPFERCPTWEKRRHAEVKGE